MDYYDLMLARRSTRDFLDEAVPGETFAALREFWQGSMRLPGGPPVELRLDSPDLQKLCGAAGYRGLLIRAPQYALLLADEGPLSAEAAGYAGSDLTLHMTRLGLEHCWLTIAIREGVREAFGVPPGKHVAGVIAFGSGRPQGNEFRLDIENEGKVDVIRQDPHLAPKISPDELVYDSVWGDRCYVSDMPAEYDLKTAFFAASIAPSYLNRQPYRLIWDHDRVVLVLTPDDLTTEEDARLGAGIVMQQFAAVLGETRGETPVWHMGAPEGRDYGLPEGCRAAAWCRA